MALSMMRRGEGDRTDRGHPQGSGKGWRPWKPQCTVAVSGVTERTKKTSLQEAFGEFGRIIRIEVPEGKSVAFVEFEEKRDANDAIEDMNGKAIEGRRIGVRLVEDLPPKTDRHAPRQEDSHPFVHAPAAGRNGSRPVAPGDSRPRPEAPRGKDRRSSPAISSRPPRASKHDDEVGAETMFDEGAAAAAEKPIPPARIQPRAEAAIGDEAVPPRPGDLFEAAAQKKGERSVTAVTEGGAAMNESPTDMQRRMGRGRARSPKAEAPSRRRTPRRNPESVPGPKPSIRALLALAAAEGALGHFTVANLARQAAALAHGVTV
mmetsp:Transcript_82767/g.239168  ORF Transcript_82767/g.239168 Transcript_82767/m.239168 type:complete len:319 (+) Transcript_82767:77-1033(+)